MVAPLVVVVPCYNEETRLHEADFADFVASNAHCVRLVFVDDGSTDNTLAVLKRIAAGGGAEVLELGANQGKAEAVRRGMLHALQSASCEAVGFWDSDLATPLQARDQNRETQSRRLAACADCSKPSAMHRLVRAIAPPSWSKSSLPLWQAIAEFSSVLEQQPQAQMVFGARVAFAG